MKKTLLVFLFASFATAQVQLGKNVQIGSGAGTVTQVDTDATSGISGGPITTTGTIACEQGSASQFGCVKPDGTTITASGGVLTATGSGGSGVQYNPSTTGYLVTSFSGLYDDGDGSASIDLGVPTSVTCTGTGPSTCTVVTAAAHGLSVGGAIDMHNLSSWPVAPGGVVQQSAQYGSFQVTTVPNSTTITFTTPTNLSAYTCNPCTGHVWDASLWAIWQFARQPYIYGHGTVFGLETDTNSLNVNWTTLTAPFLASGATPMYLIDQSGVNDLVSGGRTVSQVENDHLSVYALAHTARMKVWQSTLIPAQTGLTHLNSDLGLINNFLYQTYMSKTPTQLANGRYIDIYSDPATAYLPSTNGSTLKVPSNLANRTFGDVLNATLASQQANPVGPPLLYSYNTGSAPDGVGELFNNARLWFGPDGSQFAQWDIGGRFNGFSLFSSASNNVNFSNYDGNIGTGGTWLGEVFGRDSAANLNNFGKYFHWVADNSTSNYVSEAFNGAATTNIIHWADGAVELPSVATAASTSPICPNGHDGTLTIVGCSTGGVAWGAITGTLSSQTDLQTALNAKADLASPTFTGTPAAPTAAPGTNTTQIASTAFVQAAVSTGAGTGFNGGLGSTYQDATEIAAPANPSAGNDRLYLDSTTHKLSCKTSAGADCMPSSGSSGAWTNITGSGQITATGCTQSASTGGYCSVSGTTTTAVTLSVIPSGHNALQWKVWGQGSSGLAGVQITLNSDTSAHYVFNTFYQTANSVPAPSTGASQTFCNGGNLTTGLVSQIIGDLPFYTDTSFAKAITFRDSTMGSIATLSDNFDITGSCGWDNGGTPAAVTSVTFTLASGHFVAGTKFMLLAQD